MNKKTKRITRRHTFRRMSALILAFIIGFPAAAYAEAVDAMPDTEAQTLQSIAEEPEEIAEETEYDERVVDEAPSETVVPDNEDPEQLMEDSVDPEESLETEEQQADETRQFVTDAWMNFEDPVSEERLPLSARPYWLRMFSTDRQIHLSWTDVQAKGEEIDGYIILRKPGADSEYEELARVSPDMSAFIDDTAEANVKYYYCVVSYILTEDGTLQVSEKGLCVICMRGDSDLSNTYAPDSGFDQYATINKTSTVLDMNETTKLKLIFPEGALSKWVRWRSNNKEIATVDSKGVVTAVSPGKVKIAGRTAAGWDVYCTVSVRSTTIITGVALKSDLTSGNSHYDTVYVTAPYGRTLYLDMYQDGKWVKKKSYKLPSGSNKAALKVYWTKDWWSKSSSKWRIRVPKSDKATAYITPTITIKAKRKYQNPGNMFQITQSISKHGLSYYTSPVKIKMWSTRKDCVETMIDRAYDYLGDDYVVGQSRQPGRGVDCSGIVMQACYAAGIDLWPSNPYRHQFPKYEYESRCLWKNSKLEKVSWGNRKRGDLIFYANRYGTIMHVAIYLGNNKIIHAWPDKVRVSSVNGWGDHIAGVRRVFH